MTSSHGTQTLYNDSSLKASINLTVTLRCVCVCVCARACACVCVRVRVHVPVCVCVCGSGILAIKIQQCLLVWLDSVAGVFFVEFIDLTTLTL